MNASSVRRWLVGLTLAFVLAMGTGEVGARVAPPGRDAGPVDVPADPLPPGAVARIGGACLRHDTYCRWVGFVGEKHIASYGDDAYVLWDATTGKELRRFTTGWELRRFTRSIVARSTTGQLMKVDDMGVYTIWDVPSGKVLFRYNSIEPKVTWGVLSPGGRILAADGPNNTVRLYDMKLRKHLHTLRGFDYEVSCLAFSADSATLASGEHDQSQYKQAPSPLVGYNKPHSVRLWNVRTGKELHRLPGHEEGIDYVTFSPDGRTLAVTGCFYKVRLWDTKTGKELPRFGKRNESAGHAVFSPDSKTLAARTSYGLKLWDLSTNRELRVLADRKIVAGWTTPGFSPDGKMLAVIAADDRSIILFDLQTGNQVPISQGQAEVVRVAASPDGKVAATANRQGTIQLWDVLRGKELRQFAQGSQGVSTLLFTPDGKTLISAGVRTASEQGPNMTICLWDVATGKPLAMLARLYPVVTRMALSSDGKTLAAAFGKGIHFWDLASLKEVEMLKGVEKDAYYHAFSPDGKTLAVASVNGKFPKGPGDRRIRLWSMDTGTLIETLSQPDKRVTSLEFSPCGRTLAAGCDGVIRLWDIPTKRMLHDIKVDDRFATPLVFSPNGKFIAAPGGKRHAAIHLWDPLTGELIRKLTGHRDKVGSLAFTADSAHLVSASADATALVWNMRLPEERPAGREVNDKEMQRMWESLRETPLSDPYLSLYRLALSPRKTIDFLSKHLKPAPRRDVKRIRQLIAELDGNTRAARDHATKELEKLRPLANPELQEALAHGLTAEVRRRAKSLLDAQERPAIEQEQLREVRAMQLLERIGTSEARALLKTLASGEPLAALTRDARDTLLRLDRGNASALTNTKKEEGIHSSNPPH